MGRKLIRTRYDDGGASGGTMDRPTLRQLLGDIQSARIDVVVVYKIDRLTRSLMDFAKIVEVFDAKGVSFVSVPQQFNTTTSMGRLTLNVLLSFAPSERAAESSATVNELEAWFGWEGGGTASLYTRKADRTRFARTMAGKMANATYPHLGDDAPHLKN